MSETIIVHKLDASGRELLQYPCTVIERTSSSLTVEAAFSHPDIHLHGLSLRRGDQFVETHYTDRWYNIFAIFDANRAQFKGWYCNVTRPARMDGNHLYAEDLALDLIVYPNGRWRVVDEEEFASLNLQLEERRAALRALTELQALVIRRGGPFERLAGEGTV